MNLAVRIRQSVKNHVVGNLEVAHFYTLTGVFGNKVRSRTHAFDAARDNEIRHARLDFRNGVDNGLHAAAAHHIDGVSGRFDGNTSLDCDLTAYALSVSGR